MQSEVTHIIHCAWQLNFNMDVTTFERMDLAGVHHIATFALKSPRRIPPTVTFISSIGAVLDYPDNKVPETSMADLAVVLHQTGYGQSKYVAERVLDNAAHLGLPVHIVRAGQLSGNSQTGAWNASEYIPILIHSSISVGSIPEDFPVRDDGCRYGIFSEDADFDSYYRQNIRWIPVDAAASMILHLCLDQPQPPPASSCAYWHLEDPQSVSWSKLIDSVIQRGGDRIRRTTMRAWLDSIQTLSVDNSGSKPSVPAAKLLSFFSDYASARPVVLDTANTKRVVEDLEAIGEVVQTTLRKYVDFVFDKY